MSPSDRPRPSDAHGVRAAWADVERRWEGTVSRARSLPPDSLHERVDGEWSFVETLRHLVFVTDAWVSRGLLGERAPYHPWGLPTTGLRGGGVLPNDVGARPALDDVLRIRAGRQATVRRVLDGLTDEVLAETAERVRGPGHPRAGVYPVRRCLLNVVGEEWEHRKYAERDLAVLESRVENP